MSTASDDASAVTVRVTNVDNGERNLDTSVSIDEDTLESSTTEISEDDEPEDFAKKLKKHRNHLLQNGGLPKKEDFSQKLRKHRETLVTTWSSSNLEANGEGNSRVMDEVVIPVFRDEDDDMLQDSGDDGTALTDENEPDSKLNTNFGDFEMVSGTESQSGSSLTNNNAMMSNSSGSDAFESIPSPEVDMSSYSYTDPVDFGGGSTVPELQKVGKDVDVIQADEPDFFGGFESVSGNDDHKPEVSIDESVDAIPSAELLNTGLPQPESATTEADDEFGDFGQVQVGDINGDAVQNDALVKDSAEELAQPKEDGTNGEFAVSEIQVDESADVAKVADDDDAFGDFGEAASGDNKETEKADDDEFGDFGEAPSADEPAPKEADMPIENGDDLGDFGEAVVQTNGHAAPSLTESDVVGESNVLEESTVANVEETKPTAVENGDDDGFGDFGEATQPEPTATNAAEEIEVQNTDDDDFGDFGEAAVVSTEQLEIHGEDDFGDFGSATAEPTSKPENGGSHDDDFGDFDDAKQNGDQDLDNFGDFGQAETPKADESDDFGDFGGAAPSTQDEDDFGDFGGATPVDPATPSDEQATSGDDDNFGDFGEAPAAPATVSDDDDDFGDFGEAPTTETRQPDVPANDDDFGDFGDFEDADNATNAAGGHSEPKTNSQQSSDEDDFGDFGSFNDSAAPAESSPQHAPSFSDIIPHYGQILSVFAELRRQHDIKTVPDESSVGKLDLPDPSEIKDHIPKSDQEAEAPNLKLLDGQLASILSSVYEGVEENDSNQSRPVVISKNATSIYSHLMTNVGGMPPPDPFDESSKDEESFFGPQKAQRRMSAPEVLPIRLPTGFSPNPEDNRQVAMDQAAVSSLPQIPMTSNKASASGPSDAIKNFLKTIPDVSFMTSSRMVPPRS